MKKLSILSLVLGILVLVYAFLAYFLDNDIFSLTQTIGNIIIATGLIAFAVLIVMPDMKKKSMATLKTVEFVIILIAAIVGFVLPLLNIKSVDLGTGSLWFGIALVMDGGVDLFLGIHGKKNLKQGMFFISLLSVILGTWIYATNFVNANIRTFTFITLLLIGGYLTIIGLANSKKS